MKNNWLKCLLSLFLLYHYSASLILPNQRSYIEQHFGFLFYPYSSTLGINTPWQFFSPNPSRNIWYEYEVIQDNEYFENEYSDVEELDTMIHRWPPDKSKVSILGPNHMRLVYHSRFSTSSEERKLYFFANYFCRKHKGATAITLKTYAEEPPTLERMAIDSRPIEELKKVREWPAERFECELALDTPEGPSQ